eukprot:TRINITY_DN36829_c0_g1_i1.p2 TRINITY_DN36829_c0_g1~~TRINITY_DN36829_c0_g1_i1.p2  ORF type:complete len:147 (+),score=23.88 TRINITY_DN36829_c0_g1_i1:168-608(+)
MVSLKYGIQNCKPQLTLFHPQIMKYGVFVLMQKTKLLYQELILKIQQQQNQPYSIMINQKKSIQSYCQQIGVVKKNSYARAQQIQFDLVGNYFFVLTSDKAIEIFKFLDDKEYKKKQKRKAKRIKEKAQNKEDNGIEVEKLSLIHI